MIKEDRIAEVLAAARDLDEAVDRLIADANAAGGRDNITVVAFRLEEADVGAAAADGATLVGPAAEEAGLTGPAVRTEAARAEARRRGALGGAAAREAPRERGRRRRRRVLTGAVVALVSVGLAAAAVWGVRQVYFIGGDSAGRVALYRGLPYELPFGLKLYSEQYAAPVQVSSLPRSAQGDATNHTLRFHDDATSLLNHLVAVANPPKPVKVPILPPEKKKGGGKQQPPSKGKQAAGSKQRAGSKQKAATGRQKAAGGKPKRGSAGGGGH
jgi:protein phosphatase